MNFEPQKFFIGLVDFFSVLLPGAVLAFAVLKSGVPLIGHELEQMSGTPGWLAFLFASYLLGHVLFLLGSLLDDIAYERLARCGTHAQIKRVLSGRRPSPRIMRSLAGLVFKARGEMALESAKRLKDARLEALDAAAGVNAFQWCKARLALEKPDALVMVSRFEADSKFFRSFVPLLAGLLGWALWRCEALAAFALLVALGLAFWRYVEQRFKAVHLACTLVLTFESEQRKTHPTSAADARAGDAMPDHLTHVGAVLTHAGGVVWRRHAGELALLLVQSASNPAHWVLPKGHIERDETPERCAVREVHEESGVWARVGPHIADVASGEGSEARLTRYYLMEFLAAEKPEEHWRNRLWLARAEAIAKATFDDQRQALAAGAALHSSADSSR